MINTRYLQPVIPVSGKMVTSGHFGDLKDKSGAHHVGLFDKATYSIATGSGNGQVFFIGYSSEHTRDKLTKWLVGMQNPKQSYFFRGKDVISFQFANPQRSRGEIWTIGYDGSTSCTETPLSFECEKNYGIRINAYGSPVFRKWAKQLQHEVFVQTPCCSDSDCEVGCEDGTVDCLDIVKQLAENINNHVELSQIGVKARYIHDTFVATVPNMNIYTITVIDDGSENAKAAMQTTVGRGVQIERTLRNGQYSTYQVCLASAPSDFVPRQDAFAVAVCGECLSGYEELPASDIYTITRGLAGSEDLSTAALRETYADAIGTAYGSTAVKTFNGATAVDPATDRITLTAHGLVANTALVYSNGGGTTIVGLTNGSTYYVKTVVDANTITLSATAGGTVIDITADGVGASHTLTVRDANQFLSHDGATAKVQVSVPAGTAMTPLLSDIVVLTRSNSVICVPPPVTATAWVDSGNAYRGTRTLCMTLPKTECGADDRLAEIEAEYTNNADVDISSLTLVAGDDCTDTYEIDQYSIGCSEDGCLSNDTMTFNDLNGYDQGQWVVKPVAPGANLTRKCGLEITAELPEKYFSDCSFELEDFYETEPIRLEITWIVNNVTEIPGICERATIPNAKKRQKSMIARGSGDWLLREYITAGAYEPFVMEDSNSPRYREVTDQNRRTQVDRGAFYKVYYLQYKTERGDTNFDEKPEVCEAMIAFKEGDPEQMVFENSFLSVLSKFGVDLTERK